LRLQKSRELDSQERPNRRRPNRCKDSVLAERALELLGWAEEKFRRAQALSRLTCTLRSLVNSVRSINRNWLRTYGSAGRSSFHGREPELLRMPSRSTVALYLEQEHGGVSLVARANPRLPRRARSTPNCVCIFNPRSSTLVNRPVQKDSTCSKFLLSESRTT
jgi:hypothetical protein